MRKTKSLLKRIASILFTIQIIFLIVMQLAILLQNKVSAATFTPRLTAPDNSNAYYYSKKNPFYPSYKMPNCTAYAFGRAYEILGSKPKLSTGNAGKWYSYNKSKGYYRYGSEPKLGAIACWDEYNNNTGHVAVVEKINGSKVTISESHYPGGYYKNGVVFMTRTINKDSSDYCKSYRFLGYIYASDDMPNPIYAEIPQNNYYLKNASTGTYLNISGGKAANGQTATLSAKKNANSFKFYASGSKDKGYYLISLIDKNYALNPYSDTPGDGSKITLYKKSNDGTQQYFFEKSGSGYIIHNVYNQNCVLTPSGSNVLLKTKTGAANQVWILESADTTTVKFHRNINNDDTTTVNEKFTVGVTNQKFGYNTDGTGHYGEMNAADVGFGQWTNPGYKLLGWSTNKNATASSWGTYSGVTDNWIKSNAPSVDLYAVWQKETQLGDLNVDNKIDIYDIVLLQKYLVKLGKLTSTQWKLADLNNDKTVNVFDLIILKRELLNK